MALTTRRIIALPSQTDPQEGDYLAIDNATSGTHKIPVGRIGVEVDDTLTEQGKAADAKAVGDALDEIRSQIEVTGTASGAIATFTDGSDMPAKSVIVNIEPKQSGTGTPSPDNVRQISGWESVSVYKSGKNLFNKANAIELYCDGSTKLAPNATFKSVYIPLKQNTSYVYSQSVFGNYTRLALCNSLEAQTSIYKPTTKTSGYAETTPLAFTNTDFKYLVCTIYRSTTDTNSFDEIADSCMLELGTTATDYHPYTGTTKTVNLGRTVYGGTLDVVSGVLTAYPFYPSYNGETLDGRWICDRAVYAEGTTPPTGSQVALISGTGTTYQLTPTEVKTLLGENNVWADSGDVEVVYIRDLNIAINNLLSGSGTRSLGMLAMSAPTEATAEEPTDEQSDEDMR